MENTDWEFFFTLFIASDRAQHKLWETPDKIQSVYEAIDEFVGWARNQYSDANFVVVSDHGFTEPPERDFFINTWLSEFVDDSQTMSSSRRYGIAKKVYSKVRQTTGINLRAPLPQTIEAWITGASDDSEAPSVLGVGGNVDGIHVDETLPDYKSKMTEIMTAARELTDPETGQRVFRNVWHREDVYEGKYLEDLPEIVLLPESKYHVNPNPHTGTFDIYSGMDNEAAHDAAPNGVFFMDGIDILDRSDSMEASLVDVPATLLHLFESAIPTDFDGRVMTESLYEQVASRDIEYREPITHEVGSITNSEDRSDVEDRLEDLGYL